jgi:hypothetical protein
MHSQRRAAIPPSNERRRQPDPSQRRHCEAWFVGLVCWCELGYVAAVEAIRIMVLNFSWRRGCYPRRSVFTESSSHAARRSGLSLGSARAGGFFCGAGDRGSSERLSGSGSPDTMGVPLLAGSSIRLSRLIHRHSSANENRSVRTIYSSALAGLIQESTDDIFVRFLVKFKKGLTKAARAAPF